MNRLARRGSRWARWQDELIIAVGLALLAAGCALGGWAWRLDRVAYDLGLSLWSRAAPPDVVIVAIDDVSIDSIGRWPWPRAVHATLLERIAAARPRAIALDLVLSEPDLDPEQDRLLARSLANAAPVVLPVTWQATGNGLLTVLQPTETLRSAVRLGAAEAAVDADGVLRHAFLRAGPPDAPLPHLAAALLEAGGEAVRADLPVDLGTDATRASAGGGWRREGRLLIRYAGVPGTVERLSYADVLSGAVPPQRLAGRFVLIGMTAVGLGDTLATPVNARHQAMPGVEVLANTLYTLRSGDTLAPVPEAQVAAGSAALVALLLLAFGRFGPRRALPTVLVSVPLAVGASLLAIDAGVWFSPVPYALAALLAYPLWSWRRLERAVDGLDAEIARLDADTRAEAVAALAVTTAVPGERRAPGARVDPNPGDLISDRLLALQRAGRLVREARRFLADALTALPTAMLVADAQARVLLANPKAAALFDVEAPDDLAGLDLMRLLAEFALPDELDWAAVVAALVPRGAGLAVEGRLPSAGDFVIHVAAVDLQGVRRLIVTVADIEPVKQAQRDREEALAFVSHDLRSPASSIVLLADLNLQGRLHTPPTDLLHEVRRLAARTLQMSEDFVRAAQVRSAPLARAPVALSDLIAEAPADLRAQALAAGVDLQVEADAAAEVTVDRLLVSRAIANLVSNAIKHSPRGASVALRARLLAGESGARLSIEVRDDGPGLTPDQLAQLARGEQGAAVGDARGVGLGLLFVQRVAHRHGGMLRAGWADSGRGAVLEIELPV